MEKEIKKIVLNILKGKLTNNCRKYIGEKADLILKKIREYPDEDNLLEFKKGRPSNKEMGRKVSSFANAKGGAIFIGIRDTDHKIVHFKNIKKESISIEDSLSNRCYTLPVIQFVYFTTLNNNDVLAILIEKCKKKDPVSYDGIYYIREGKKSPEISFEEIAQKYPKSYIAQLIENFHIFLHKDTKNMYSFFQLHFRNDEISFLDLEELPNQDILIYGKNGTGKTFNTLKLIEKIAKEKKQPFIILMIKQAHAKIKIPKIIKHNVLFLWNDLHKDIKSFDGMKILDSILNLQKTVIKHQNWFRLIGNYRIEESKILFENGFFDSDIYNNSFRIKLKLINDQSKILSLLDIINKKLKINFGVEDIEEKKELLLNTIIKNNPSVGYIISLMLLIKRKIDMEKHNEIKLKFITDIPSDIKDIWINYFKSLNKDNKALLKSIRFLNELNVPIQIFLLRKIYSQIFQGDKLQFNELLINISKLGWVTYHNDVVYTWDAQMESVPFEDILEDKEIVEQLVNILEELKTREIDYYLQCINAIATKIMRKSIQEKLLQAFELFKDANKFEKNIVSLHGMGLCKKHHSDFFYGDLEKKMDLLNQALEYYLEALEFNKKSYTILTNIGAAYNEKAHISPPGEKRWEFLNKGKEYLITAYKIAPKFSGVLLNMAGTQYRLPLDSIDMDYKWNNEFYKEVMFFIEQSLKYIPLLDEEIQKDMELYKRCYSIRAATNYNIFIDMQNDISFLVKAQEDAERLQEIDPNNYESLLLLASIKFQISKLNRNNQLLDDSLKLCEDIINQEIWEPYVFMIKCNCLLLKSKSAIVSKKFGMLIEITDILENKLKSKYADFFKVKPVYHLLTLAYEKLYEMSSEDVSNNYIKLFFKNAYNLLTVSKDEKLFEIFFKRLLYLTNKDTSNKIIVWQINNSFNYFDYPKEDFLLNIRLNLINSKIECQYLAEFIENYKLYLYDLAKKDKYQQMLNLITEILALSQIKRLDHLQSRIILLIGFLLKINPELDFSNNFVNFIRVDSTLTQKIENQIRRSEDIDIEDFKDTFAGELEDLVVDGLIEKIQIEEFKKETARKKIAENMQIKSNIKYLFDLISLNTNIDQLDFDLNNINLSNFPNNLETINFGEVMKNSDFWLMLSTLISKDFNDPFFITINQYIKNNKIILLDEQDIFDNIVNALLLKQKNIV